MDVEGRVALVAGTERFPFPIPYGWYSLGRLDELAPEDVVPVQRFGRDLALWRDGDDFHLFDAYCPHLGAHFGHGGRVEDGCLVCPFHEWTFAPSGQNQSIPYADRPNRKGRVRRYPTVVRNRQLLAWYHPDPTVQPGWEIPEALPEDPVECMRFTTTVRSMWQEIAENSVDMAHFKSIHGMSRIADIGAMTITGPLRQVVSTQAFKSSKGEFEGQIESNSYGPGIGVVHFTLMSRVTLISAVTPISNEEVEIRFTMYHTGGDTLAGKIALGFGAEVTRQLQQDIPIWEHKLYQPSPMLAPSEKAITQFRKWASQFYSSHNLPRRYEE